MRPPHASSPLRFSFSSAGEKSLLQSLAARKYSTQQAQSALERGVLQLLSSEEEESLGLTTEAARSTQLPAARHSRDMLYEQLSAWSFEERDELQRTTPDCNEDHAPTQGTKWRILNPFAPSHATSFAMDGSMGYDAELPGLDAHLATDGHQDDETDSAWPPSPATPTDPVAAAARLLSSLSDQQIVEAVTLSRQLRREQDEANQFRKTGSSADVQGDHRDFHAFENRQLRESLDVGSANARVSISRQPSQSDATCRRLHPSSSEGDMSLSGQSYPLTWAPMPALQRRSILRSSTASLPTCEVLFVDEVLPRPSKHTSSPMLALANVGNEDPLHSVADELTLMCERASGEPGSPHRRVSFAASLLGNVNEDAEAALYSIDSRRGSVASVSSATHLARRRSSSARFLTLPASTLWTAVQCSRPRPSITEVVMTNVAV
ncbi:unnamed protein product [Parajaminaea phylloscopi]